MNIQNATTDATAHQWVIVELAATLQRRKPVVHYDQQVQVNLHLRVQVSQDSAEDKRTVQAKENMIFRTSLGSDQTIRDLFGVKREGSLAKQNVFVEPKPKSIDFLEVRRTVERPNEGPIDRSVAEPEKRQ